VHRLCRCNPALRVGFVALRVTGSRAVAFAHGDDGYGGSACADPRASAERTGAKPAPGDRSLHTRNRSRVVGDLVEDLAIGGLATASAAARSLSEMLRIGRDRSRDPPRPISGTRPAAGAAAPSLSGPPRSICRANVGDRISGKTRARGRSQGLCELCANWEARSIGRAQPQDPARAAPVECRRN